MRRTRRTGRVADVHTDIHIELPVDANPAHPAYDGSLFDVIDDADGIGQVRRARTAVRPVGRLLSRLLGRRRPAAGVGGRAGGHASSRPSCCWWWSRRFLAVGLNPIVELLIRTGLKRGLAVLVVALGALAIASLIVFVLVSVISNEVTSFFKDGPHLLDGLLKHAWIRNLNDKYHFITKLQDRLKNPDLSSQVLHNVFSEGITAVEGLLSTVVVIVLTLYFLAALPQLKRGLYTLGAGLAPGPRRPAGR